MAVVSSAPISNVHESASCTAANPVRTRGACAEDGARMCNVAPACGWRVDNQDGRNAASSAQVTDASSVTSNTR